MIKRFSESGKKRESTKVRRAKLVLSSVKGIEKEVNATDKIVNQVYTSFQNPDKKFTASQLKQSIVAFAKMDRSLNKMFRRAYLNLKAALSDEFPTDRIASQIEDIHSLRAKLAILRGQAAASLGFDGADELDEELIEIDEAGYAAEELDEEDLGEEMEASTEASSEDTDVTPPVQPSAEPTEKPISGAEASSEGAEAQEEEEEENEIPPAVPEEMNEEMEEDEEMGEEMEELGDQIELEDYEIDDAIGDEILPEMDEEMEEDEEMGGELSASASLKNKKMASSKVQSGGVDIQNENSILSSIMQELIL